MKHLAKLLMMSIVALTFIITPLAQAEMPSSAQKSLAPMLENVTPAIVNVLVQGKIPVMQQDPKTKKDKDDDKRPQTPRFSNRKFSSYGSGVIVDAKEGFIITNAHVVNHANTITITLKSGHKHQAKLIGSDPASDVALLKIDAKNLTELPLYDSDQLEVGDFVAAIGSPFRLEQTVTSGIISGLQRSGLGIEGYEEFIQTDAPINPGNSGGALVDMDGHLIGINTAILSPGGGSIGIGFAIPSNMVKDLMVQLAKYGHVQRGLVGILVQPLTPSLSKLFKSPSDKASVVTQVSPNSPAAQAGVQVGDVILKVNGTDITNAAQIRNIIGLVRIGTPVKLVVSRNGKTVSINTKSGDPDEYAKKAKKDNHRLFGMTLNTFDQHLPTRGHIKGVAVVGVTEDSLAWKAGLRAGDVITAINHEETQTIDDVEQLLTATNNKPMLVHLLRGSGAMFVAFD